MSYPYYVVKIHEKKRYAALIRGDYEPVCRALADIWTNSCKADNLSYIHYIAMPADEYDRMEDTERRGGASVYEQIFLNTNYHELNTNYHK